MLGFHIKKVDFKADIFFISDKWSLSQTQIFSLRNSLSFLVCPIHTFSLSHIFCLTLSHFLSSYLCQTYNFFFYYTWISLRHIYSIPLSVSLIHHTLHSADIDTFSHQRKNLFVWVCLKESFYICLREMLCLYLYNV